MKRFISLCVLACALTFQVMAAGAPAANFAGTWSLDKTKSEGLSGPMAEATVMLVVTQDAKQLTTETTITGGQREMPAQKMSYNMDGSESTVDVAGRMPGKATVKAKWSADGNSLDLSSVRQLNIQGNDVTITTQEHWELADGGKTLKVHRKIDSPRGAQEMTLVYAKK
jgi:hypothetical protein